MRIGDRYMLLNMVLPGRGPSDVTAEPSAELVRDDDKLHFTTGSTSNELSISNLSLAGPISISDLVCYSRAKTPRIEQPNTTKHTRKRLTFRADHDYRNNPRPSRRIRCRLGTSTSILTSCSRDETESKSINSRR